MLHWQQRAKMNWIMLGDRNNNFFQAAVKLKRNSNRISSIQGADGSLYMTHEDISNHCVDYFTSLYTAKKPLNEEQDSTSKFIHEATLDQALCCTG